MEKNGYEGDPILAYSDSSGSLYALTGVHRIEAAKESNTEIPIKIINGIEEMSNEEGDYISDMNDEEEIIKFLEEQKLKNSEDIDEEDLEDAIALMKKEREKSI
jgi:predicted metal-dependent phosphoesterase TrpH